MSYRSLIEAEAIRQGVPVSIALAVAEQESAFNPNARGSSGEIGLFQLMPATAAGLGVDPYDIDDNIRGGVSYLAQNFARFGNWDEAIAAYNAGPSRVANANIPSSTRSYVSEVLERVQNWLGSPLTTAETPLFSTTVYGEATPNYWLLLAIGLGVGSLGYMALTRGR